MSEPPALPPDPRPPQQDDPAVEVAKAAGAGCLAGVGVVGMMLITALLVILALAAIGVFLLYLMCSGH